MHLAQIVQMLWIVEFHSFFYSTCFYSTIQTTPLVLNSLNLKNQQKYKAEILHIVCNTLLN